MNNKFETEKERKKLLSISLIEHFYKNTLDWISVKALYPFSYALYLSFPIIKARLKKHFFHSFAKKKFIPVRSFVSNFKTYLEIQMYCVKSKRRYFWCAPPPSPRKEPLQTIPHLRARRAGLVPEVARGGGGGWQQVKLNHACIKTELTVECIVFPVYLYSWKRGNIGQVLMIWLFAFCDVGRWNIS